MRLSYLWVSGIMPNRLYIELVMGLSVAIKILILLLLTTEAIDLAATPCRLLRAPIALPLRAAITTAGFGIFLMFTGSPFVAATLVVFLAAALTVGSNIKYRTLGEPLVFSDVVALRSFVLYPRFYLGVIPNALKCGIMLSICILAGGVYRFSSPNARMAALGAVIAFVSGVIGYINALFLLRSNRMGHPHLTTDLHAYGLVPTLAIYWMRWKRSVSPSPIPPIIPGNVTKPPEILLVVQCESFAEIPVGHFSFPGLQYTREKSVAWGDLYVSGFGAYTMRTEYGVLCGRNESELGFRSFDPFLTADTESSFALPHRLSRFFTRSVFIHPHDMRFYDRAKLMPSLGFNEIIGEDHFPPPAGNTPYISDMALGERLMELVEQADEPTLLYAVTMENHGPWAPGRANQTTATGAWEHHAANSDALLRSLSERLAATGRDSMLVFFGDHRPSIPGSIVPGGAKHTPYVVMRFPDLHSGEQASHGVMPSDLTPAGLYQLIISLVACQMPQAEASSR